jgi:hypothetical protein
MLVLPEFAASRARAKNARAEGRTVSAAEVLADFQARHPDAQSTAGDTERLQALTVAAAPRLLRDSEQANADLAAGRARPFDSLLDELDRAADPIRPTP